MASEASGKKSGTSDLPYPYTLSLAAQMAAAPWTDEPAYRDQVRTLKGKLIGCGHECGLCGGDVLADVAARAVIAWLIRRHGFTDPEAHETEVAKAIDLLNADHEHDLSEAVPKSDAAEEDVLPSRSIVVLEAMLTLGALSSDERKPRRTIVDAISSVLDPITYGDVFLRLKGMGFVKSKLGRDGGYWLTDAGKLRAESI